MIGLGVGALIGRRLGPALLADRRDSARVILGGALALLPTWALGGTFVPR